MSKRLLVLSFLALAVFLVQAAPAAAAPPLDLEPFASSDREMALMNQEIPGFGGLFYDREGFANVFLTDPDDARALDQLGPDVRVLQGEFQFNELRAWRHELRSAVLGLPGVVTLDVDESTNRVRVGVDRQAAPNASRRVARQVAQLGIPGHAVVVEAADPIYQLVTLRDQLRPVPGGVQIHFGNFLCTLGFNAVRSGVEGFVTNSHCTNKQGGVESTQYFQPVSPAAIAIETVDPTYRKNIAGCPRGKNCRYSDSAFARYDSTSLDQFARIARPVSVNLGSLEINATSPTFAITSTSSSSVGQTVNKVGRTTGWTAGVVDATCVDVSVSGSNIAQLCQDIVLAGVGGGDSGSPVFADSGSGNVSLRGILWGGNNAGTLFVYSPFANIIRSDELGPLTVH
jgi:hypothetical protein